MEVVYGVSCIKGEIHSIITLMRLNTRWSAKSTYQKRSSTDSGFNEEDPLVESFRKLNLYLEGVVDLSEVDVVSYVLPFHNLIVSEYAGSNLTSAALSSLSKFALYGFFSAQYPRAQEAMSIIAHSISHCVFEETDWESDELILMKLLELSILSFRCNASSLFSAASAWDIFTTCKSVHEHYRASKILRNEAESALVHLTLNAFSRASHMVLRLGVTNDVMVVGSNPRECLLADSRGITLILVNIVQVISHMLEDQNPDSVKMALTLTNVALEAGGLALGSIDPLIAALSNDICRHLLRVTQSDDLAVFSCALRVVFNLFMSIKDYMKVQLEVFLTSVHLRVLNTASSQAREELVLESLLEFCREPSLIQDVYINYDCDVRCTNLFDSIVQALCRRATLDVVPRANDSAETRSQQQQQAQQQQQSPQRITIVHKLSFEGIVAILHGMTHRRGHISDNMLPDHGNARSSSNSRGGVGILGADGLLDGDDQYLESEIDRWCENMSDTDLLSQDDYDVVMTTTGDVVVQPMKQPRTPVAASKTGRRATEAAGAPRSVAASPITSSAVSVANKVPQSLSVIPPYTLPADDMSSNGEDNASIGERRLSESSINLVDRENELTNSMVERSKRADLLRKRKVMKQRMKGIAELFNSKPMKPEWMQLACEVGVIQRLAGPQPVTGPLSLEHNPAGAEPKSVAECLKSSPGLGKQQIGEFISKGPADRYPFHALVLQAYVRTFNYRGKSSINSNNSNSNSDGSDPGIMSFDEAMRLFLSCFRLPGEAQTIDRIMEAFAGSYFEQLGPGRPFATADAVFILAFSTIMLNTDLHNPGVPAHKKMTKEQFIRNNRDIDDGKDLPREYLEHLYDNIKAQQIQVQIDVVDTKSIIDFSDPAAWQKLIGRIAEDQAPADFTSAASAQLMKKWARSGARPHSLWDPLTYQGDMFVTMARPVFQCIFLLWDNLSDDGFLRRILQATVQYLTVAQHHGLHALHSSVVQVFIDCSWQYMAQLRRHQIKSYSKLNILVQRPLYEQWLQDNGSDLRQLVTQDYDQILSEEHASSTKALWLDAALVKGEVTLRVLMQYVLQQQRSNDVLGVHSWHLILQLLLWTRSRGALPRWLSTLTNSFPITSHDGSKGKVSHQHSNNGNNSNNSNNNNSSSMHSKQLRFAPTSYAKQVFLRPDRIESSRVVSILQRLPQRAQSSHVLSDQHNPQQQQQQQQVNTTVSPTTSQSQTQSGSWFPAFLWSSGDASPGASRASRLDPEVIRNLDRILPLLHADESDAIFGDCNDIMEVDSLGSAQRTDDWLLQQMLEQLPLSYLGLHDVADDVSANEVTEGEAVHSPAMIEGLLRTAEWVCSRLSKGAIAFPTAASATAIVPASSSTSSTSSTSTPAGDAVLLADLFPTHILRAYLPLDVDVCDALLCLEWLSNCVLSRPQMHWLSVGPNLLDFLTFLLHEEMDVLSAQHPMLLERVVVVSFRSLLVSIQQICACDETQSSASSNALRALTERTWSLLKFIVEMPCEVTQQLSAVLSAGCVSLLDCIVYHASAFTQRPWLHALLQEHWHSLFSLITVSIFTVRGRRASMQAVQRLLQCPLLIDRINYIKLRQLLLQLVTHRLPEAVGAQQWAAEDEAFMQWAMRSLLHVTLLALAQMEYMHVQHASTSSTTTSSQQVKSAPSTPARAASTTAPHTPQPRTPSTPRKPLHPTTPSNADLTSQTNNTSSSSSYVAVDMPPANVYFHGLRTSSSSTASAASLAGDLSISSSSIVNSVSSEVSIPVIVDLIVALRTEEIEQMWLSTAILFADWTVASRRSLAAYAIHALEMLVCAAEKVLVSPAQLFMLLDEGLVRLPLQVVAGLDQTPRHVLVFQAASLVVHMLLVHGDAWKMQYRERFSVFFGRLVTTFAANVQHLHQQLQLQQQQHQQNQQRQRQEQHQYMRGHGHAPPAMTHPGGSAGGSATGSVTAEDFLSLLSTLFRVLRLPAHQPTPHPHTPTASNIPTATAAAAAAADSKPSSASTAPPQGGGGGGGLLSYLNPLGYLFSAPSTSSTASATTKPEPPAPAPPAPATPHTQHTPHRPTTSPVPMYTEANSADWLLMAMAYKSATVVNPALSAAIRHWDPELFRQLQDAMRFREQPPVLQVSAQVQNDVSTPTAAAEPVSAAVSSQPPVPPQQTQTQTQTQTQAQTQMSPVPRPATTTVETPLSTTTDAAQVAASAPVTPAQVITAPVPAPVPVTPTVQAAAATASAATPTQQHATVAPPRPSAAATTPASASAAPSAASLRSSARRPAGGMQSPIQYV